MHKKAGTKRKAKAVGSVVLTACLTASMGTSAFADTGASANKYFNDYNSEEEALDAARALNKELSEEGNVLLKNDGTLPLNGTERISVFGVSSDSLVGGSANSSVMAGGEKESSYGIAEALQSAGFNVNPTLMNFYKADSSEYGEENLNFTGEAKASMEMYDDAAVVVLSREGGEGADVSTATDELVKADDDHKSLKRCNAQDYDEKYDGDEEYFDEEGYHYHKHNLMLTDSEQKLMKYVKKHFNKVIVVLNTSNAMEMGKLQNDDSINAILWMGRPGESGVDAVGEILNGTVNPSGRLVDEWMTDFTTDPTWYNFAYNDQNGSSNKYVKANGESAIALDENSDNSSMGNDKNFYFGVDYEEGIYMGYKYYETYYHDIYTGAQPIPAGYEDMSKEEAANKWWADNVTYAFGYGLSYTNFSYNIEGGLYTEEALENPLGTDVDASAFSSDVDSPQQYDKLYVPVTVTNTGDTAGKEVVQVYVSAPYTSGGIEKASQVLVGYAKTDLLQPGESQTVTVSFNVQDMASYDYNDANGDGVQGDYELDAGTYTVRVMKNSHYDLGTDVNDTADAYSEVSFNLTETAHQHLDDYSQNEVSNHFSADNGVYDDSNENHTMYYNSVRTGEVMEDEQYTETILSRTDMAATFPQTPVYNTTTDEEGNVTGAEGDLVMKQGAIDNWTYYDAFNLNNGYTDQETDKWYIDDDTLAQKMEGWTQEQDNGLTFSDMAGVSLDDTETWNKFMNELSWDELCSVIEDGGYSTTAVDSVGKTKAVDADGPNNFNSTYVWCDEVTISSTWNVKLAEKEGRIMGCLGMFSGATGWYGPGMNIHRSPFSGRNNEYYSQDGIQGGYMVAAVVKGAESKGLVCYVKHLAFNEQETCRDGKVLFAWIDEQTMRENLAKGFQMALQEGGSSAAMTGYARIGGIPNTSNYDLITEMLHDEWGWDGYLVTDGYIGWREATELDIMVRAGSEMQLYTAPFVEELSGEWDAEANSVRITPTEGDSYISNLQYYYVREAAKTILYQTANSTNNQNGFINLTLADGEFTAEQFITADGISVAIDAETLGDSTAVYSIVDGTLPQGMELDAATGAVTGKAEEYGTFTFTVEAVIDTYVRKNATYTMTVNPAFYIDEDWDALDDAQVGVAFESRIESDIFTTEDGRYDEVVYSVESGTLPAGMELSADGAITGTPEAAGIYDVVVKANTSKTTTSTNMFGMEMEQTETNEGTYAIRIIVKDENGELPAEAQAVLDAEAEAAAQAEAEAPAEGEVPTDAEAPADAEAPEGEAPAEAEAPTEGEAPADTEAPTEGEAPAEAEIPAE